jgi:hypothetical protein
MVHEETKDKAISADALVSPGQGAGAVPPGGPELAKAHATSYKKVEKRAHTALPPNLGKSPKAATVPAGAPREMSEADEAAAREQFNAAAGGAGKELTPKQFKQLVAKVTRCTQAHILTGLKAFVFLYLSRPGFANLCARVCVCSCLNLPGPCLCACQLCKGGSGASMDRDLELALALADEGHVGKVDVDHFVHVFALVLGGQVDGLAGDLKTSGTLAGKKDAEAKKDHFRSAIKVRVRGQKRNILLCRGLGMWLEHTDSLAPLVGGGSRA